MHNTLAQASALTQEQPTDYRHPHSLVPAGQMLGAALLGLDLDAARRESRRVGPPANLTSQREEFAATKRTNRSALNEIAASLGISRSRLSWILEEPPLPAGGRQLEPIKKGGDGKRHDHGTGRRRHAGADRRRHAGR